MEGSTEEGMGSRIFIASDHNGNAARAHITRLLTQDGFGVVDLGPDYDSKVDYVDYAERLCLSVLHAEGSRGVLICGTGTGMLIAANRFPWIRAGLATDRVTARLMREHNDANVIVLGLWRTPLGQMDEMVREFLSTSFEGGRHTERVRRLWEIGR